MRLVALAAAALLPSLCVSWWDTGHMLTVAIARQRLSAAAVAELEQLIHASRSVQATSPVPSVTMVSAAHWADDVKNRGWSADDKILLSPTPTRIFVAFDAVRSSSSAVTCHAPTHPHAR